MLMMRPHWFTTIAYALVGLVLALVVSFVQPLRYSSTVRLLVLQDVGSTVDAYTASRSEERIADNLSTIIYTTTFFDQVLASGFEVEASLFPKEDARRRRAWERMVEAIVARGSGLLTVRAFHTDVRQAEQVARAVAFVLTKRASEFTSGSGVDVRLIDAPLNSRWPVKPNVPSNAFSGLVLGALAGFAHGYLQKERVRRRHQLIHE